MLDQMPIAFLQVQATQYLMEAFDSFHMINQILIESSSKAFILPLVGKSIPNFNDTFKSYSLHTISFKVNFTPKSNESLLSKLVFNLPPSKKRSVIS